MISNAPTDEKTWPGFGPQLAGMLDGLPLAAARPERWQTAQRPPYEGLTIPAAVNYVGKGANLIELGYKPGGAAEVVVQHLRTTWLWDKIRVQGGAYGGGGSLEQ